MLGLTGIVPYVGGGLVVSVLVLGGYACNLRERVSAKSERISALEMAAEAWGRKVAAKEGKIEELTRTIDELNGQIDSLATIGARAEGAQAEADRLAAELARARSDLQVVSDSYREMRELAVGLDVCQTYGLVLRKVAGGGS